MRKPQARSLDLEAVQPARNMDVVGGTRSRRSATRRPLMMPADRSARLSSVCSRIWRDGKSDRARVDRELGQRAVEVHQDDWSCVVGPGLPGRKYAINSTHGTSHPALPATRRL